MFLWYALPHSTSQFTEMGKVRFLLLSFSWRHFYSYCYVVELSKKQLNKMAFQCDNEETADIVETEAADSDDETKTVSSVSSFILSF